jgi:Rad3-related DNA helicase
MDGFENESIISTISNQRPLLITVALMSLVFGGYCAFQKQKQQQERVEQWETWYADQERQYVTQFDAYATCKSEAEGLRDRGELLAGEKKDSSCSDLKPVPLNRKLLNMLEEKYYPDRKYTCP